MKRNTFWAAVGLGLQWHNVSALHVSRSIPLNATCNSSPQWQLTQEAYVAAGTDLQLSNWYEEAQTSGSRLDRTFGKLFGVNNFQCSIDDDDTCVLPSCFDFENNGIASWVYLAGASMVNLNNMFNVIWDGLNLGSSEAKTLTDDIADRIYKWHDPIYSESEVAVWVGAAVSIIGAAVVGGADLPVLGEVSVQAVALMITAGLQQIAQSLQPDPGATREVGIDTLNDLFYSVSVTAQNATLNWSNNTFAGNKDSNGHTVLNYLANGSFIDGSIIPSPTDAAAYFRTLLVSKAINGLWAKQSTYLVAVAGKLTDPGTYPLNASWYSANANKTFILYSYNGKAVGQPPGMDVLDGDFYGIKASQVAEASARAWLFAGNNYTSDIAAERIQASFTSNGTLTPFQDGAGWEGMFTFPVCDVGPHNAWASKYGQSVLPCCCGPNCADTHDFIEKANLNKSANWFETCKKQLKKDGIDPKTVDFGISEGSSAHRFWIHMKLYQKILFVGFLSIVFAGLLFLL